MILDPASISAGIVIGTAIGGIAGRLSSGAKALRDRIDALEDYRCIDDNRRAGHELTIRTQGRRIAELLAEKHAWEAEKERRLAPLRKHNEKRHAAKLAREAQANEIRQKRLAEMRAIVGELV